MDVIFGRITASKLSMDWINALARQQGLTVGDSLFAFRFAAASDNRGKFYDSQTPPLSRWTRPTTFRLEYPQQPAERDKVPMWEQRLILTENASIDLTTLDDDSGRKVLDVTVTCLGRDYGGPGVLLGEMGTYWSSPPPDPCPALLRRIDTLMAVLGEEPGPPVNERKKIIQEIGFLTREARRLHCRD
jgi:hypothetical protein